MHGDHLFVTNMLKTSSGKAQDTEWSCNHAAGPKPHQQKASLAQSSLTRFLKGTGFHTCSPLSIGVSGGIACLKVSRLMFSYCRWEQVDTKKSSPHS